MALKTKKQFKSKKMVDLTIGGNVKILRDELGITQEELADRVKMSRVSVSQIESGKQGLSVCSAVAFANALEIGVDNIKRLFNGL